MGDATVSGPDHSCLFDVASTQGGYFTTAQAGACGFGRDLLSHHARTGRFVRINRGLYRLRDYPSWPREHVMAAWLAAGRERAVVSHESALDLLNLSDVMPNSIHLTVPRSRRHLPSLPDVTFHTTVRPLEPGDISIREGIRVTSATRTILDSAQAGTAPEQIEMSIRQALDRGLTTRSALLSRARERSQRVQHLILNTITQEQR